MPVQVRIFFFFQRTHHIRVNCSHTIFADRQFAFGRLFKSCTLPINPVPNLASPAMYRVRTYMCTHNTSSSPFAPCREDIIFVSQLSNKFVFCKIEKERREKKRRKKRSGEGDGNKKKSQLLRTGKKLKIFCILSVGPGGYVRVCVLPASSCSKEIHLADFSFLFSLLLLPVSAICLLAKTHFSTPQNTIKKTVCVNYCRKEVWAVQKLLRRRPRSHKSDRLSLSWQQKDSNCFIRDFFGNEELIGLVSSLALDMFTASPQMHSKHGSFYYSLQTHYNAKKH